MKQKEIFLTEEGNAWFKRNIGKMGKSDPVTDAIVVAGIKPKYVLEVGCANGWRLDKLRTMFGCGVMGVEPSLAAGMDAARFRVPIYQMTASCIPVTDAGYDMIIYGFCLYLTDPDDWFLIVAEADRVLAPGGHVVIHDFFAGAGATARKYEHRAGVRSYHFDFAQLWLAHPLYEIVNRQFLPEKDETVVILRKKPLSSIPVLPE